MNLPSLHPFVLFGPLNKLDAPCPHWCVGIFFTQSTDSDVYLFWKQPYKHRLTDCFTKSLGIPQPNQAETLTITAITSQREIPYIIDAWTPKKFMSHLNGICFGNPREVPTFLSAPSCDSPRKHAEQKQESQWTHDKVSWLIPHRKSNPLTTGKKGGEYIASALPPPPQKTLSSLRKAGITGKTTSDL